MSNDQHNSQREIPSFVDFDIEIESRVAPDADYVLSVRSPSGEVSETMKFPFSAQELESRLKDIQIAILRSASPSRLALSPETKAVQEFGRLLFNALMAGDVRNKYAQSQIIAREKDQGLRLKLRIKPPELASLPWEFLWDSTRADFVCLMTDTLLVRYIEVPLQADALACKLPLRILGMVASPADREPLKVAAEKKRVTDALAELIARGQVELVWLDGGTWQDLFTAMRAGPWHVFHFIGHGGYDRARDEGIVLFENPDGSSYSATATQLARLLAGHHDLRLVVLNSCEGARGGREDLFSSSASILLRHGIPSVLAMQYEISDAAALEFSRYFYEALADGVPVDASVDGARIAMSMQLHDTLEWATPVLYMRSPDGVLFNIDQTLAPAKPPEQVLTPLADKSPESVLTRVADKPSAPLISPVPDKQPKLEKSAGSSLNKYILTGVGALLSLALLILLVSHIPEWIKPSVTASPPEVTKIVPPPPVPTPLSTVTPTALLTVTPTTVSITLTPDPLTLPAVQAMETYWSYFGNRNFEAAWDYLSARFQADQFGSDREKYIASQTARYCGVGLSNPRVLTSTPQTMYVLGTVVYKVGAACIDTPSNFVHKMTLSGSTWLIDRVISGVVDDSKCAQTPRTLVVGGYAHVATHSDPLIVRAFPAVTDKTLTYSDEYKLGTLPPNIQVVVIDGPICGSYMRDKFWWWKVRSPDNLEGWVVAVSDPADPLYTQPVP